MANEKPQENWADTVEFIQPYVFRISTPGGFGTGFVLSRHSDNTLCAIATAAHVIDHAHYWDEPIRLEHTQSGKVIVARSADRAVFLDESRDSAVILLGARDLELPENPLFLAPK